jgi:hypothetical protein
MEVNRCRIQWLFGAKFGDSTQVYFVSVFMLS